MKLQGSTILVLGGFGLVGSAVCRKLMEHNPGKIIITSLKKHEALEAVHEMQEFYPQHSPDMFIPWWGDIFIRNEWREQNRGDLLANPETRKGLINDCIYELTPQVLHNSALYQLISEYKPDAVIDCVNTATAFAYQDVFATARDAFDFSQQSYASQTEQIAAHEGEIERLEKLIASLYIPQLTRHIQILYKSLVEAKTTVYLKVGTSGTGGMGLNIPYTHSEGKPSNTLLAKSAMAGAQSLLLFLAARTPDGPIVKEIKPSATIAWKAIKYGEVKPKRQALALVDMPLELAKEVSNAFNPSDFDGISDSGENVQSVYIDTGENGMFSRAEFQTISALGQMEIVTPEEIADSVVFELRGGNTGLDIMNALDSAVMGPTYRGGIMRNDAIEKLKQLEEQHGVQSVAFEMLGPPRLSKLLFEANILKRIAGSIDAVLSMPAETISAKAQELLQENTAYRSEMVSVGLVILLADGKRYLRGKKVIVPASNQGIMNISNENLEKWCYEAWVDLRPTNFQEWKNRFERIKEELALQQAHDTSSRYYYSEHYWSGLHDIDEGKITAWIFEKEDNGWRMKR